MKASLKSTKVNPNRFATALVPTLTRFFASPDDDRDPAVYETAYVRTDEQINYDSIFESLLRDRAFSHRNPLSQDIETSKNTTNAFTQRLTSYAKNSRNTSQILLVVGHVGAGKSLFIRRYRELLVPVVLSDSTFWSFINFNDAKPSLGPVVI
jgi:predicted Ser/Thr protein kinase